MDEELAKYRRAPRTIITPVTFNSKKYFLLGSVAHEGVFTLDRPITIVEAVARAHGLQTVLQQHDLVEIADLQRAFLVRHGARLPVDFGKLFGQGDLSQNVQLAPGDYLYFPPADLKQIYVVGEVMSPGIAPWAPGTSALRAVAEQGGFTSRAWKKKVLVIRGSLEHPQAFVVDASAVLSARAPDFKLEPDDIVYVHYRPWIKAEELMDLAATAFVQSATIYWTGMHVGPLIAHPFIK
jgi:protein involved in polysaccharide export with SLBB domain